jgi:IS1 family transposase
MAKRIHQMTIPQWEKAFPDEEACCAYLAAHRWPDGVTRCPRCGAEAGELSKMPWHWQCYQCAPQSSYRFSILTGTIFENSNKPLRDWFRVLHTMLTSKKGVSALQIYRTMGFGSYKTAWYMCHRLRLSLPDRDFQKLVGIVELDETFVGGKKHNKHWKDRNGPKGGAGGKTAVVGAVSRTGKKVVAKVLDKVTKMTVAEFVAQTVQPKVSVLMTDEWPGYKILDKFFERGSVDHSREEYVVGAIHTNTIEGFWSILKRGVIGTYHKVSKKYLPLYVAEFCFRYNNRENENIFEEAIRGC